MKNRLIILTICIFFFLTYKSDAQWIQTNGPYGGHVKSFVFSGTNIFAGTDRAGVFLSTNNGTNWKAVNTGLSNTNVFALVMNGTSVSSFL